MYSENKDKARVGKVTVIKHRNAYRIRFTFPKGKRHDLKIANATDAGWQLALKVATLIDLDIANGCVDLTYAKYSPRLNRSDFLPLQLASWSTDCATQLKHKGA